MRNNNNRGMVNDPGPLDTVAVHSSGNHKSPYASKPNFMDDVLAHMNRNGGGPVSDVPTYGSDVEIIDLDDPRRDVKPTTWHRK